ncbi:hypothetical protein ABZ990_12190 [Streptomyces sp. NPDC046203]|uniref:hypothetical protein n=1 Tax=Streptomyces sp. NPDC046203 TaxID=3154602 RepID=UPI0034114BA2
MLCLLAMAACLPYIALKVAWVAGSRIGIPDGSGLLDHRTLMIVANGVSVLADALVVLLALLLTRPWGSRVRAWLLAFPMWAATGLLAPIVTGYPAQLVLAAFGDRAGGGSGAGAGSGQAAEPFLDAWVFPVVYGGFIVQALCLGTLFALYAHDRWSRVWAGRLGTAAEETEGTQEVQGVQEVQGTQRTQEARRARGTLGAPGTRVRVAATAGAVLAAGPAAMHALWAAGATVGLPAAYASEYHGDQAVVDLLRALFLVAAVVATLCLAWDRPAGTPVRTTLAWAWVASGAAGCWGAYMTLVCAVTRVSGGPMEQAGKLPTALMITTYAGEMLTGFLLAGCLAAVLAARSRRLAPDSAE